MPPVLALLPTVRRFCLHFHCLPPHLKTRGEGFIHSPSTIAMLDEFGYPIALGTLVLCPLSSNFVWTIPNFANGYTLDGAMAESSPMFRRCSGFVGCTRLR